MTWNEIIPDDGFFDGGEPYTEEELERLQQAAEALCKENGHVWEEDDHAGPDSGYMGATCTVCGYSWGEWLY